MLPFPTSFLPPQSAPHSSFALSGFLSPSETPVDWSPSPTPELRNPSQNQTNSLQQYPLPHQQVPLHLHLPPYQEIPLHHHLLPHQQILFYQHRSPHQRTLPESAAQRGRGGTTGRGGKRGRGSRGTRGSGRKRGNRRATGTTEEQESLVPPPPASPGSKHAHLNNLEDDVEERLKKRARARGMNAQEKLFLIRECCEHAAEV